MANPVDDAGNVRVDHVWGNLPMQPNDQRGDNVLDYALDNHVIAQTGRYGFPAYTPGTVGDGDDVANVTVPNVVGLTAAEAETAIEAVGLVYAEGVTTTVNATVDNDGEVASQSPAAGASDNYGDTVTVSLYEYIA